MGNRRTFQIFDGGGLKSGLLWDEDTDAWTYYSNSPLNRVSNLYRTIPTIYRGIEIISNEAQNVPFTVYGKGDTEVDNTADWQNKVGFLPNPRKVIGLISQSLDRHGVAYLLKSANVAKYTKALKWLAPASIEPEFDLINGELLRFRRTLGTQVKEIAPKDMLYFWLADSDVENSPPQSYPLRAAMQAAGVLHNLDTYVNMYFERGAIRPTIVSAKGMPSPQEQQRLSTWFNRLMGGIRRAFKWEVFNAETLTFQQIGDGLDQLQNQTLTADQRQDVALALGIPQTILFANSANYATSQSDMLNFYNMTVVPRCEFIAEVLNEQILEPMGYHIEASPESLDVYKEDEQARSQSLGQLVTAGVPLLMAMDLLGYDLTDEQRAELEALTAQKEERAEEMAENLQSKPEEPEPPEQEPEDDEETKAELKHWRRLCNKALRENQPMPLDFVPDHIPAARAAAIANCLRDAKTGADIKAAFEQETPIPLPADWPISPELLAELKRANDILENISGIKREFSSDEERRAAFAHMAEDEGGGGSGKFKNSYNGDGSASDKQKEYASDLLQQGINEIDGPFAPTKYHVGKTTFGKDARTRTLEKIAEDIDGDIDAALTTLENNSHAIDSIYKNDVREWASGIKPDTFSKDSASRFIDSARRETIGSIFINDTLPSIDARADYYYSLYNRASK